VEKIGGTSTKTTSPDTSAVIKEKIHERVKMIVAEDVEASKLTPKVKDVPKVGTTEEKAVTNLDHRKRSDET